MLESILAALALVLVGYTVGSVKIVNQGNQALVERVGRYHRKLKPGLNFVVPFIDTIVLEDTIREQVLDTEPQIAITKDNISLEVDAVVYWRILELERSYYEIQDIEKALTNLVVTTMRSEIGRMELEQTYSSRSEINQALLQQLDEATGIWGVKVTRVEVQNITPPQTVLESLELERAAESKKRAAILEAEGKKQAAISEAEGTVRSLQLLSDVLRAHPNSQAVLQYLVAQRYVDANYKLGESENSKIVFMDPKALTEAISELVMSDPDSGGEQGGNGRSPRAPNPSSS